MMRAIVTGATGYIGGQLLARLLQDQHDVAIVVRRQSELSSAMINAKTEGRLKAYRHHGKTDELVEWVKEFSPEVVFHLAAMSLSAHRPDQLRSLIEANVVFGAEMLEAAAQVDNVGFISTGTFWEYGRGDDEYRPTSLYAATKRAFRDILGYFEQTKTLRSVELKLFDVYGPDDPRGRLIDLLLDAQVSGEQLALSPGEQQIDLVHVDDVVEAYLVAAECFSNPDFVFERLDYAVSSGCRMTVRELVARLESVSGRVVPVGWGKRAYRPREVMMPWTGQTLPNWRPRRSLDEGITQMIAARQQDGWRCA